ncbi:MAG TPA: HD domain-containing phosphohydrolase [Solirubrobacteraceae bacterium]|nr:HD domain-containing phosphohydrolase [Solirubrobacteraceae bacterium]
MPQLLIVDDEESLRRWEERVVRDSGYSCDGARDASSARERLASDSYRLALLDVNMPGDSGIELLSEIRRDHPEVAVLMVTGEDSTELAMAAIELGAYGYLVKPIGSGELIINVANALHRRRGEAQNQRVIERLQSAVQRRSDELAMALQNLELSESKVWASQAETIFRLARMVEFRDEETGRHVHRMSSYCEIVARQIGYSAEEAERVRLASQLHDVGKVAIPDSVLLKPGKLTPDEFEVVKGHTDAGYKMLQGSSSEIVQLGSLIAYTHHERWDGTGYPRRLAGEVIPQEGRIAAVADVFDALTTDRVYRPALPIKSAVKMMRDERGQHFDPTMLDAFFLAHAEVEEVRERYAD